MQVDFGKTASDYARHRVGFPEAFFDRLFREGIAKAGERVLDLGTGTGVVARGFARRGCHVVGLDRSNALLEEAKPQSASWINDSSCRGDGRRHNALVQQFRHHHRRSVLALVRPL